MKYKCISNMYIIDNKGEVSNINKGDIVKAKIKFDTKYGYGVRYSLFTEDEKYLGEINCFSMERFFEDHIEEQEECTVTREEAYKQLAKSWERHEKKTLKGWQILKLIDEDKVTDGTIFTTIDKERNWSFIYVDGTLEVDNDELYAVDLINSDFIINKHTELITFKEALERNVNIKHKDWKIEYTTPQNVLNHYTKIENAEILQDLFSDDKVWEVETDD